MGRYSHSYTRSYYEDLAYFEPNRQKCTTSSILVQV